MVDFKIPDEYTKADFGFSAIDEATYKAQQSENETLPTSVDENDIQRIMLNLLKPLEDKLDNLVTKRAIDEEGEVDRRATVAEERISDKLRQLEEIIMPLLVNLNKTADKEYIYWPGREKVIEDQMKKVLSITRG
jgi:hypothetical protein